jgi:hypothetical protein
MPEVSLTRFVDFVSKAGTPKMTVVREWKHKGDYSPATDFYKPLREFIVALHTRGGPRSELGNALHGLTDRKKLANYPAVISGHRKWMGRKRLDWFTPPRGKWSRLGLDVLVKPELGLNINGVPHLIKLYFKSDAIARNRVQLVTHLMASTVGSRCPGGCVMAVLDIRNARCVPQGEQEEGMDPQLEAEAAYWMSLWPRI